MPVEAQTVEYVYLGDGATKVFSFPSKFLSADDIFVGLNGVEQSSGYTASGAGNEYGGTVTFITAPANGVRVSLLRRPPASQLLDFVNGQTVLEGLLDNGLDKLTMLIQYLLRGLSKSVRLSEFDHSELGALPFSADRANKFLAFDATGALTAASNIDDVTAAILPSQAEAVAGVDNTKMMTPLRTAQHVDSRVAAQADVDQSVASTSKVVSPWVQRLKLRRFMIDPYDWKGDYGALFDGTGTGAADKLALQAAIDYAYGVGGGEIRMPAVAKINSSAGPLLGKHKVSLLGQGRGASRLLGDGTGTLIKIGGSTTVDHMRGVIADFQMDTAQRAVDLRYRTASWRIEDLYITGILYPIRVKGKYDGATVGDTYDSINNHIKRCELEAIPAGGVGISLIHCGDIFIAECNTPSASMTGTVGLQIDTSVTSVQSVGNNFIHLGMGLNIRDIYGFPTGNPRALPSTPRECWFDKDRYDSGGIGAQIEAGYDMKFTDAWACGSQNGEGFLIGGGGTVQRMSFVNPIVKGNKTYGLRTVDGLGSTWLDILGGEFASNGFGTANSYDNIYIGNGNSHFSIKTKSYSTAGTGLNNCTRYGVNIGTGCESYEIGGDVDTCLSGAINDNSKATATHRKVGSLNGSLKQLALVNTSSAVTGAVATGSTVTPYDDTIPQITEGAEFMTVAHQPRDVNNKLRVTVTVNFAHSAGTWVTWALHRDAVANALAASAQYVGNAGTPYQATFVYEMTAGQTTPITFRVRGGGATGATLTFNGVGGARQLGGVLTSSIRVEELAP